jgi:YidC/Oxa1 family membrane protein insertase
MKKELPRYLLIGAMAVLGFMLMVEWGNFKKQKSDAFQAQAQQEELQPVENNSAQKPAAEISATNASVPSTDTAANNSDIPQLVDDKKVVAASSEKTIQIKTDVLNLKIDLLGGDIVDLSLPKYPVSIEKPNSPFLLLEQNKHRTYVAMSGLIGDNGIDTSEGRAQFSSEKPSYNLVDGQDELIVNLVYQGQNNASITKRFSFKRSSYLIDVSYQIDNRSNEIWRGVMFGQLKRDSSEDPSKSLDMGMSSYLGAATTTTEKRFLKLSFGDFKEEAFKETVKGGWVAMIQHYFLTAWIPKSDEQNTYSTSVSSGDFNLIRFTTPTAVVPANSKGDIGAQIYAGPKDQYILEKISPGLDLSVDYGFLWWIAQPLFWLLVKIHGVVGNWGWSIVAITIIVKAIFFQLNAKAYLSMANMRRMQPKMLEIKERFANDRQKQSTEMMALYKKEKINPMGGCLPILVQMPVFMALYWVLLESVELRQAPWIFWIKDLSQMDAFYILPLLMGISMFIQQKLNPQPPDPMQAKMMQWMPVIFTFFFLWFPSGLVLYWVVNNCLSIAQQWVITKRIVKDF